MFHFFEKVTRINHKTHVKFGVYEDIDVKDNTIEVEVFHVYQKGNMLQYKTEIEMFGLNEIEEISSDRYSKYISILGNVDTLNEEITTKLNEIICRQKSTM